MANSNSRMRSRPGRFPGIRFRRRVLAAAACAVVLAHALQAHAELPLLSRRNWAYVSVASAVWCGSEAWRAHDRAGDMTDRIAGGAAPAQIEVWKAERKRSEKRTQAMLGLAGCAVATAVYLFRTQDPPELPDPQLGSVLAEAHGLRVCLDGDADRGSVRLRLNRSF